MVVKAAGDERHHVRRRSVHNSESSVKPTIGYRSTLEDFAAHGGQRLDDGQMEPNRLGLGADDASRTDSPMKRTEEWLLKEHLGGSDCGKVAGRYFVVSRVITSSSTYLDPRSRR